MNGDEKTLVSKSKKIHLNSAASFSGSIDEKGGENICSSVISLVRTIFDIDVEVASSVFMKSAVVPRPLLHI